MKALRSIFILSIVAFFSLSIEAKVIIEDTAALRGEMTKVIDELARQYKRQGVKNYARKATTDARTLVENRGKEYKKLIDKGYSSEKAIELAMSSAIDILNKKNELVLDPALGDPEAGARFVSNHSNGGQATKDLLENHKRISEIVSKGANATSEEMYEALLLKAGEGQSYVDAIVDMKVNGEIGAGDLKLISDKVMRKYDAEFDKLNRNKATLKRKASRVYGYEGGIDYTGSAEDFVSDVESSTGGQLSSEDKEDLADFYNKVKRDDRKNKEAKRAINYLSDKFKALGCGECGNRTKK